MIPGTSERVPQQTHWTINEQIRRQTRANIDCYRKASHAEISRRLEELEQEWDIERVLEANAASASLLSVGLGLTVDRRWFFMPAVIGGFLLQHAIQGWCPPVPLFRRLGYRTQREIDEERYALKAIRGDFDDLTDRQNLPAAEGVLEAVES
jgi:hypothetical protein